jgi:hypothetical protein
MFLLDADKKIIAKQLGAEQLGELLERLEGESATGESAPSIGPADKREKETKAKKKS